jgi:DNA uptake protein ComE-like DNA-binding protein
MNGHARLLAALTKWIFCLLAALSLLGAPYQAPKDSKSKAPATSSSASTGKLIDINSASADELKSLPGIGDAYSAKIIQNRPYANKRQLISKSVVPQATYDKISDRIIAKQSKGK